jgi:hypothetical protein
MTLHLNEGYIKLLCEYRLNNKIVGRIKARITKMSLFIYLVVAVALLAEHSDATKQKDVPSKRADEG